MADESNNNDYLRRRQAEMNATDKQMADITRIVESSHTGNKSGPNRLGKELKSYLSEQKIAPNMGEAWCAETAAAIQHDLKRNIPGPDKEGASYPLARRWAESWGKDTNIPHVGDVIVTGGDKRYFGGSGHIRTITAVGPQGEITTIGGNQGNKGQVDHYANVDAALHPKNENTHAEDKRPYRMKTATAKELTPQSKEDYGSGSFAPRPYEPHEAEHHPSFSQLKTTPTQYYPKPAPIVRGSSNPSNPYHSSDVYDHAIINDTKADGQAMKQNRPKISPSSLAGTDPQSLPFATHVGDEHNNHEAPVQKPPTYKNGQMVRVRKLGNGEWEVLGPMPSING